MSLLNLFCSESIILLPLYITSSILSYLRRFHCYIHYILFHLNVLVVEQDLCIISKLNAESQGRFDRTFSYVANINKLNLINKTISKD